jgi:hypothetical protein
MTSIVGRVNLKMNRYKCMSWEYQPVDIKDFEWRFSDFYGGIWAHKKQSDNIQICFSPSYWTKTRYMELLQFLNCVPEKAIEHCTTVLYFKIKSDDQIHKDINESAYNTGGSTICFLKNKIRIDFELSDPYEVEYVDFYVKCKVFYYYPKIGFYIDMGTKEKYTDEIDYSEFFE